MNNHTRNQAMTILRNRSNLMRVGMMHPNNNSTIKIYHLTRKAADHLIFSKPIHQTSVSLKEGMDVPLLDTMIYFQSNDQRPNQPPFTTTLDEEKSSPHSDVMRCLTIGSIIPIYQMPGLPLKIFTESGSKL